MWMEAHSQAVYIGKCITCARQKKKLKSESQSESDYDFRWYMYQIQLQLGTAAVYNQQ